MPHLPLMYNMEPLLPHRLGRGAIGYVWLTMLLVLECFIHTIPHRNQNSHSPQTVRLKKTTSFSTRFQSFRSRHTILARHSMENITQPAELTYQQPMQQTISKSPSQCLSLSLTPPPSPTPSHHAMDVASSCSYVERSGDCHLTLAACNFVYTSAQPLQLCADSSGNDSSGNDSTAYNTSYEIGNLDSLLQTLEEKFKEHKSTIVSNPDQHASPATIVRKKRYVCLCVECAVHILAPNRSISATDIHCVKANHITGYIKNHLSSVELNRFSYSTIIDPHVRSLVFDACDNNAQSTEL